jgi:UDP-N-acetyl-L-fucosamine synthase
VLDHARPRIEASDVLLRLGLEAEGYFVASLHREENVDHEGRLLNLLQGLEELARRHQRPVIVSTHPRTRKRIDALGFSGDSHLMRFLKPLGFHDYNRMQLSARCVISDSGTIAEEASILGFAAVTPRDAIERPEGLDVGTIVITGTNAAALVEGCEFAIARAQLRTANGVSHPIPSDYQVTNTSERVVSLIVGTARLSNDWDGIRSIPSRAGL